MTRLSVLTPWIGSGTRTDKHRPAVINDHPLVSAGSSWIDRTGQSGANLIPSPNLFILEIVCDDTTAAAIQADANYSTFWSEPA